MAGGLGSFLLFIQQNLQYLFPSGGAPGEEVHSVVSTLRAFLKIQTSDATLNRIQDNVARSINSIVALVKAGTSSVQQGPVANRVNNPAIGQSWFDPTTNKFYIWNGSKWVAVTLS